MASLLSLPARDHGAGEILMMHEARQDHRRDMHEHERKRDVGDELMHAKSPAMVASAPAAD